MYVIETMHWGDPFLWGLGFLSLRRIQLENLSMIPPLPLRGYRSGSKMLAFVGIASIVSMETMLTITTVERARGNSKVGVYKS